MIGSMQLVFTEVSKRIIVVWVAPRRTGYPNSLLLPE